MNSAMIKTSVSVAALLCAAAACHAQVNFPDTEPNNTKATANAVNGILPGDTITGVSTSSSTTATGNATADNFLIRTAPAPLAIYRHRIIIAAPPTGTLSGTLRGLTVTNCIPNAGTDTAIQNSASNTTPARMDQWYGFGREEQIYWRISGTSTTTAAYTATYARDVITPLDTAGMLAPGTITIEAAPGNATDLDMAIYDHDLNAVPDYSNDGDNRLQRPFAAGTYYLAICPRNLANNLPCPADETWRIAGATDFPNVVVSFTNIVNQDLSVRITHTGGSVTVPMSFTGAFDVMWLKLNIADAPACGTSDFNGDGDFGTDADIEAFFACLGGDCCPTCWQGGSDFNGDGDFGTDADIEAFFRVLGGGVC